MLLSDFYVTIDKESFFDLQIHLGRLRVECGSTTPQDRGSTRRSDHGRKAGQGPSGL